MGWTTLAEAALHRDWTEEALSLALEALRENRDPSGQGVLRRRAVKDAGERTGFRLEYSSDEIEEAVALYAAKSLGFRG
jgi:hypothetical protein